MKGKILIGLLFLAFLLPRIFISSPYYFVSMDEAKYLGLAASFPTHTLFNNQLYLVHPPLFPYLIRFFSLFSPDHIAGMAVSLLFAVVSFAAMVRLFKTLGKGAFRTTIALSVLALSSLHIPTSRVIYKDSMFLGLFLLSLALYVEGLVRARTGYLLLAGISGCACCLTSDLGVYLLPCFVIGHAVLRKEKTSVGSVITPFLIAFLPYCAWLLVRLAVYRLGEYYPAGVDGTIEYVRALTPGRLFTPRYFPATATMFDFSPRLNILSFHGNVYPLSPLFGLPLAAHLIVYALVAYAAVASVVRAVGRRKIRGDASLFFSILLVLFAFPVIFRPEPRFVIPILLPMGYLLAEGVFLLAGRLPRGDRIVQWIALAVVVCALAGAANYVAHNTHLIFTLRKEVEGEKTARYLEGLPGDGVMAQVGYPPELAYLTDKRVVSLPPSPEKLDEFIRRYAIEYLLYGQHYWGKISEANAPNIWCYKTIRHIRENPERYPLLKVIDEEYAAVRWPDRVFVHSVRQD